MKGNKPPYDKDCSKCTEFLGCKGVWQEECKGPHIRKPEDHEDG